jgi:hypothetical protein
MFDEFYKKYPRKMGKKDAQKAWNKLKPEDRQLAIKAIDLHIKYWEHTNTDRAYIPYPATWLNSERFHDEIIIEAPKEKEIPWTSTEELTIKKGKEIGLNPYAGESLWEYRQRISITLHRKATNTMA